MQIAKKHHRDILLEGQWKQKSYLTDVPNFNFVYYGVGALDGFWVLMSLIGSN